MVLVRIADARRKIKTYYPSVHYPIQCPDSNIRVSLERLHAMFGIKGSRYSNSFVRLPGSMTARYASGAGSGRRRVSNRPGNAVEQKQWLTST